MITRNALLAEQEQFFTEIRYNKGRYIDFLDTMARFHKYPLRQQISLFFHAASDGTAYAGRDIWERLGTTVRSDAKGVPILDGEDGREDVRYIFEAKDTLDYNREDIQARLWKYDEDIHGAHIARIYPDGLTTAERIALACNRLAHETGTEHEPLLAATSAYIVMARMGLSARDTQAVKVLMASWPESAAAAEDVLQKANEISGQILSPLGQWIRTEGREQHDAGLLHDDAGDGRNFTERDMGDGSGGNGGSISDDGDERDGGGVGRDGDPRTRGVGTASDDVHPGRETEAVEGTPSGRGGRGVPEEVSAGDGGTGEPVSGADGGEGTGLDDSGLLGAGAEAEPDRGDREGVYPGGNLPIGDAAEQPEELPVPGETEGAAGTGEDDVKTKEAEGDTPVDAPSFSDVMSKLDFAADMSSTSGKRKVFQRNLAAIRLVKQLETDGRKSTEEERMLLRSYAGWGGVPEAFDPYNSAWKDEYNLLRSALSDEEFTAARASALNAHYTPTTIVESIYEGLQHLGFENGNILEELVA